MSAIPNVGVKFSYWLLEILTKQLMKIFLQSVGFNFVNFVNPVSPAYQKSSVFIKANKAFTSIFMVFVALVRFYLLHNFNKVDLLKKERGEREAFWKDF